MKSIGLFFSLMLSGLSIFGQCNLAFVKPEINGGKLRITLQMSSGIPFSLGPNNLRFNYPVENLGNPVIVSDNFPADIFGETTLVGTNRHTGVVSVNTAYYGKNAAGAMPISKEGKDLVTLEFDILKPAEAATLSWRIDKQPKTAIVSDDKMIVSPAEAKPLSLKLQ